MKRNSGHPRGWRPAHLEDLVFFQRGFDITKAEQRQGNIPVVSSSGIQSYHSEAKVEGPGVVIGRKGSLGTVHFVDCPYWPHDTTLWSKDLRGNDPRYVYYFVHTMGFERYDVGNSNPTLNRNHIHGLDILIPPLRTQKAIVEVLSTYDDLIENNRRRIQLLEQAARLLYKEWFVHLRFPGHEHTQIIDGVPEGWENTLLPDVIDVNPKTPVEKGKEILYVPMSALSEAGMTANTADFERRTTHTAVKFKKSDVLLARITPCLENGKTGYVYFLGDDEVACGSTEFIVLRGKSVSPAFTYCLARSYPFRGNAIKSMIGSSGRQRVQVSCFDEYKVPLPPKHLLEMFDDIANTAFDQIRVLVAQNDKLTKARDLLLPKLMNGEVVV